VNEIQSTLECEQVLKQIIARKQTFSRSIYLEINRSFLSAFRSAISTYQETMIVPCDRSATIAGSLDRGNDPLSRLLRRPFAINRMKLRANCERRDRARETKERRATFSAAFNRLRRPRDLILPPARESLG